jgi:hypothetical protein
MSHATVWRIGGWLNLIQTTFVGLLRVLSVPIVLMLSVASGYTTYYGLSFFITPWIALIVTVAVQSIIVICSLELAGIHWRANPPRYLSIVVSLLVALIVSVTFSYFKFYEFSRRDALLIERQSRLSGTVNRYLADVVALKSRIVSRQQLRIEEAARDTRLAFLSTHPGMAGKKIGKGPVWGYYNEIQQGEQERLKALETRAASLERNIAVVRGALQSLAMRMGDIRAHDRLIDSLQTLQGAADQLASSQGLTPVAAPRPMSFAEFSRGMTPSFEMWKDLSWFALACAAMVDFFTLILSYRLETTAPGPLTEEEKDLAFQGLRQFGQFTINRNDELEFRIERTELERARRLSDWRRMFAVAFLLNRGYLRKMTSQTVEFAPNLYPIISERLARLPPSGGEDALAQAMREKFHG